MGGGEQIFPSSSEKQPGGATVAPIPVLLLGCQQDASGSCREGEAASRSAEAGARLTGSCGALLSITWRHYLCYHGLQHHSLLTGG